MELKLNIVRKADLLSWRRDCAFAYGLAEGDDWIVAICGAFELNLVVLGVCDPLLA